MARTAEAKPRLIGINHVALEVGDIDAALDFYGRFFDFTLRGREEGMAFIDLGDQFIALFESSGEHTDRRRHFGLVVDGREGLRRRLEKAQVEFVPGPGLDFLDPWGNHIQVVEYGTIQFTKTSPVLEAMGAGGLSKSPEALAELREKGMAH